MSKIFHNSKNNLKLNFPKNINENKNDKKEIKKTPREGKNALYTQGDSEYETSNDANLATSSEVGSSSENINTLNIEQNNSPLVQNKKKKPTFLKKLTKGRNSKIKKDSSPTGKNSKKDNNLIEKSVQLYDDDGHLKSAQLYDDDGHLKSVQLYDDDGHLKSVRLYDDDHGSLIESRYDNQVAASEVESELSDILPRGIVLASELSNISPEERGIVLASELSNISPEERGIVLASELSNISPEERGIVLASELSNISPEERGIVLASEFINILPEERGIVLATLEKREISGQGISDKLIDFEQYVKDFHHRLGQCVEKKTSCESMIPEFELIKEKLHKMLSNKSNNDEFARLMTLARELSVCNSILQTHAQYKQKNNTKDLTNAIALLKLRKEAIVNKRGPLRDIIKACIATFEVNFPGFQTRNDSSKTQEYSNLMQLLQAKEYTLTSSQQGLLKSLPSEVLKVINYFILQAQEEFAKKEEN